MRNFKSFLKEETHTIHFDIGVPEHVEDLAELAEIYNKGPQIYVPGCKIEGALYALNSKLKNLKNGPSYVSKSINLERCRELESLEGMCNSGSTVSLEYCTKLTTLEHIPRVIHGWFNINYCSGLTTLKYFPKIIMGTLYIRECSNIRNVLRLLTAHQIFRFDFELTEPKNQKLTDALIIVQDHYKKTGDADILDCKADLIDAGLSEYAKL
ncbi:MAG: hypothetical protein QXN55_01265 [Candidatus Nitrosotenuis sp.]